MGSKEPVCMRTTLPVSKYSTLVSFSYNLGRWAEACSGILPGLATVSAACLPPHSAMSIRSFSSRWGLTRIGSGAQVGKLPSHHLLLTAYKKLSFNQVYGFILKLRILKGVEFWIGRDIYKLYCPCQSNVPCTWEFWGKYLPRIQPPKAPGF